MKTRNRNALCVLALICASGAASAQPEYQFTLVEAFTPNYNLRECYIWDINDQGLACGTATREFQVPNGTFIRYSGFTWTALTEKTPLDFTTLPRSVNNTGRVVGGRGVFDLPTSTLVATIPYPPGGMSTMEALGINDAGTVVGYAQTCVCSNSQGLLQIPFVWDAVNGTRGVPVPGAKELVRVNAGGLAAGNIRGGTPGRQAFIYNINTQAYTVLTNLLPPGQFGPIPTTAYDVNDAGQMTGDLMEATGLYRRGYVWSAAAGFTTFAGFSGMTNVNVYPKGINNGATVVGYAQVDPGASVAFHGFVWDAQRGIRDLNTLAQGMPANFIIDRALKINDQGWIVGDGHYGPAWGSSRAFVLRPIAACYANCDGSTGAPLLNVNDFICFQSRFAAADPYADCDHSGALNVNDFVCFQASFASGCH